MNTEEKNLPENENAEEVVEVKEGTKKGLPLGALIGIIAGAVAVVVAVILIVLLAGGNKCDGHVDADDDYLCDKCGEHYDDGDEAVIPDAKSADVTFTVKLDNGNTLSGVKFILTRGEKTYELTSGADGSVKKTIDIGTYSVTYDHETLPEYCWGETYGVKIEEGTSYLEILIVDNRPDGSSSKPFPVTENTLEITLVPGEELYYSCRGTSLKYLTINNSNLTVQYGGESYSAVDGVITVAIFSEDIDSPSIFAVKNPSENCITTVMELNAPLGSDENPIKLSENSAIADIPAEGTVYYLYTAEKDGICVITSPTEGNEILITRYLTKVVVTDGYSEELIIPITTRSSGSIAGYIYVAEGDEIKIGVSYLDPGSEDEDNKVNTADEAINTVEFSVNIYAATEAEPAPIINSEISILLDAGASVVFSTETGKKVTVNTDNALTVMYNGDNILPGTSITIGEAKTFAVINSTYDSGKFILLIK